MSARIPSASALAAVAALVLTSVVVAQSHDQIAFVRASAQQRLRYLATARIWSDPGDVTPEMVTAGRPLKQPSAELDAALRGQPLPCDFAKPGKASVATRRNSRA